MNERFGASWRISVVATSRSDETDAWLGPHRAPLVRFVLPLVNGDLQAAEDVVQETMLRGWQHSTELEPERAGSWLHTVARNIAVVPQIEGWPADRIQQRVRFISVVLGVNPAYQIFFVQFG